MEGNAPTDVPSSLRKKLDDIGLARGTFTDALITAAVKALLFIVLPILLIGLLTLAGTNDQVSSGAQEMRTNVLVFGSMLVAISFAWAYHLRSSKARLFLGLVGAVVLVIYGYSVFMTGGFSRAMSGLGWTVHGDLAFGIVCYLALRSALRFVRDYDFFRKALMKSEKEVAPFTPRLGWGEFDRRLGSFSSAASTANRVIWGIVVRWSVLIMLFMWMLAFLGFASKDTGAGFLSVLSTIVGAILLMGVPMTVLAWFKGFYPKGTVSRTVFDIGLSLAFVLLIFLIFILSGLPQAAQTVGAAFPIWPIGLALIMWEVIEALRAVWEFREERRTWKVRAGLKVERKKPRWQVPPESHLYELSPEIGKVSRGLVSAEKTFFRFVILPEVLVILGLGAAFGAGAESGPLFRAMANLVYLIPLFGLLLTVISFGRGFYPAGSLGRMLVGLLLVPGLFLYVFNTFLTMEVQEAAERAGLIVPYELIVTLVIVTILFVGFLQVTELIDARRAWLISVGKPAKPLKPITRMNRRQEFRFRFGSTYEGTIWARKGMVRYLYYTTIIIIVLLTVIESSSFSIAGIDLSGLDVNLRQTYVTIVLLAIPLAAARAAYGFYPAGSTSKLTFGILMCLVGASYTYLALQGGQLVRGGDLGSVRAGLSVDFSFIVYGFLIGWALFTATILVEYLSYRKEWVANDYRPVASAEVEALNRQRKILEKEEQRARKAEGEGISYSEVLDAEAADSEGEVEEEIRQEIGETALQASKTASKKGA
ncbi:MAG: hypothetical protein ISF22_04360 [Methanomassiliicoccus sp.]|nr:hypothetical protein [Methanomassiliicoccus sp.]